MSYLTGNLVKFKRTAAHYEKEKIKKKIIKQWNLIIHMDNFESNNGTFWLDEDNF